MTLILPASILEEAREFFEAAGSNGQEGTAMLAGRVEKGMHCATRIVIPQQRTGGRSGCWVEVTETGKLQLAASLGPAERWVARIHSHPGRAFHSPIDDANPVITAEGSWSIVAPYFGLGLRHGISGCAVLRIHGGRWRAESTEHVQTDVTAAE